MTALDVFFGEGNELSLDNMSAKHHASVEPWLSRWEQERGPAFLPRSHGGLLSWYGLLESPLERREVQALLPHWLGPAHSDAGHRRGAIDPDDPFDRRIQVLWPGRIVRVDVLADGKNPSGSLETVQRRLESMLGLLEERPPRRAGPARHVSVLLDALDIAATSGEWQAAEAMLAELEQRRLLDAPNSTFVEVRVRSLLGQHATVMAPALLQRLAGLTIPNGVVTPLARSAYEVFLREADEGADSDALAAARSGMPSDLARILQHVPASAGERSVIVAQAVALGDRSDFATLLRERLPGDPHLRGLLSVAAVASQEDAVAERPEELKDDRVEDDHAPAEMLATLFADGAHETLIDIAAHRPGPLDAESHTLCLLSAHELQNPISTGAVLEMVERDLGPASSVAWPTRLLRTVVEELLTSLQDEVAIASWDSWFNAAADGAVPDPDELSGVADWPPLDGQELLSHVENLADPAVLAPVLGRLRAAHLPVMSRSERGRLATTCLTALSMASDRDALVRMATLDALRDAVDAGLDQASLRAVVTDVQDILVRQLSVGTVQWMCDVLSELVDEASLHLPAELTSLMLSAVDQLRPAFSVVSHADWRLLDGLLRQVGSQLPSDLAARLREDPQPDPLEWIVGRSVFLYCLRERPIRQVAARLREAGAKQVVTSAEKDGSKRLEGQVRGADVVVIVTSAAKHPATDAIEQAAATPHLIRIHADGASRILGAIEEAAPAA